MPYDHLMQRAGRISSFGSALGRVLAWLNPQPGHYGAEHGSDTAGQPRISLLSVVREKNGKRYMAVDQINGTSADCVWLEGGLRKRRQFPLQSLEVVPALGADDHLWREAFRAATHRKVG